MAGAIENKTEMQRLAAEAEALLSIATYKDGEMAALIESITSPNAKKSTAIMNSEFITDEYEAHRHPGGRRDTLIWPILVCAAPNYVHWDPIITQV